jgi:hypothetical protein
MESPGPFHYEVFELTVTFFSNFRYNLQEEDWLEKNKMPFVP